MKRFPTRTRCDAGCTGRASSNAATLSRDIHELRLVKTSERLQAAAGQTEDAFLPSVERLIASLCLEAVTAQNLVVVKTSAAVHSRSQRRLTQKEWDEVAGTIGGDDTILVIAHDAKQAEKVAAEFADFSEASLDRLKSSVQPAVFGATGYSGFELARLLARHPHESRCCASATAKSGAMPT